MYKIAGRHFNRILEDVVIKFSKFNGKIYITNFTLEDQLSSIFSIKVSFITEQRLKFNDIMNSNVIFEFKKHNLKFSTCVFEFEETVESNDIKKISSPYFHNKITLLGEMFFLTKNIRCKVYKLGNPEDHIKSIFKLYSLNVDIKVMINDKKYICQYNESDYDFFCRICNHYKIGYYYNARSNKYVIHDKESYLEKINIDGDIPFIIKHFQDRSSVTYRARTKWSTNTIFGNYDAISAKYKTSKFLNSYYQSNILKHISENHFNCMNKTLYIFQKIAIPLFAGCRFNNKIVRKINIDDITIRNIRLECFDNGIEIPEFNNNRNMIVLNGLTQLEINKTHDNYNIIDNEYDIPIKMFFDDKILIKARQYSNWLGKFYGFNFPIREQTEVSVLFLDDLMSCAIIINCYFNNSNSKITNNDYVGIVTSTIGSSSSEKYMNKLLFKDKINEEQTLLESKKDILINSDQDITFKTNKTIHSNTESLIYDINKEVNIDAKEKVYIKSKEIKIDSQSKQEIKSDDAYTIVTKNKISLNSSKVIIGDNELDIKCNKVSIKSKVFEISSDNLSIKSKVIKIESDMVVLKLKMLNMEINLLKMQIKMLVIESSLLKIEGKLLMLDGKSIILKSPIVVVL